MDDNLNIIQPKQRQAADAYQRIVFREPSS